MFNDINQLDRKQKTVTLIPLTSSNEKIEEKFIHAIESISETIIGTKIVSTIP